MAAILLFVFHAAVGGVDGVRKAVGSSTAEAENFTACGIVLRDESGIVALFDAPTPTHGEALAEQLNGSTGLRKVISAWIEHIATASNLASLSVDVETEYAGDLWTMAIAIVEECQCTVVMKGGVVLAAEALVFG